MAFSHFLTLLLPPTIIALYLLVQFPAASGPNIPTHSSLAALLPTHSVRVLYPEDLYDGGNYVTFPYGKVRYWLVGPENGKKIVLIHGLSVPSIMWKDVVPALAANGFRVLVYDLYGRGYSDAPKTEYHTSLFTIQLALLMQHIGWDKATVAGVSMGGAIAAAFTYQFPSLVDGHVILIACAGLLEPHDISRTVKVMSAPLAQKLLSSQPLRFYLGYLASKNVSAGADSTAAILGQIIRHQSANLGGFNSAVALSLRNGPIRGLAPAFEWLGASNFKVLVLHGTSDNVVPYQCALEILKLVPQASFISLDVLSLEVLYELYSLAHILFEDDLCHSGVLLFIWTFVKATLF